MPQNPANILVVMVTGGSLVASVISSELVTMETSLNEISTLTTVSYDITVASMYIICFHSNTSNSGTMSPINQPYHQYGMKCLLGYLVEIAVA